MPYVDGFVAAVPTADKDLYLAFAARAWPVFQGLGAIAMWENWGEDVPGGNLTSLPLAVKAGPDETVVFSWTLWPDKAARDAGWARMMEDPGIGAAMGEMPFDGTRMIFGGFTPVMIRGAMPAGTD